MRRGNRKNSILILEFRRFKMSGFNKEKKDQIESKIQRNREKIQKERQRMKKLNQNPERSLDLIEGKNMEEKTFQDKEGILRWKENGQIPPFNLLVQFIQNEEELQKVVAKKMKETKKQIEKYKNRRKQMSAEARAEERAEMKKAFGSGKEVVNTLTEETFET